MEQPQYIEVTNKLISECEIDGNNSKVALVQNSAAESQESMGCDINMLSCSCESNGGDINIRSCNFSLESDSNYSNISEEVLDYLHMLINSEQQNTSESITTLKETIGKNFTELLINLSERLKYMYKIANLIRNCGTHQQYTMIIAELDDSNKILTCIKDNFFCAHADQEHKDHRDDTLQYVILPILLDRANKIADILRNIGLPFQEGCSSNDLEILLSIYDGIARVVKQVKDIDCRPYYELINEIQQLRACLDNVDKLIIGEGWQIDLCIFIRMRLT